MKCKSKAIMSINSFSCWCAWKCCSLLHMKLCEHASICNTYSSINDCNPLKMPAGNVSNLLLSIRLQSKRVKTRYSRRDAQNWFLVLHCKLCNHHLCKTWIVIEVNKAYMYWSACNRWKTPSGRAVILFGPSPLQALLLSSSLYMHMSLWNSSRCLH